MNKIHFNFGWCNGWSPSQAQLFNHIFNLLDADPSTAKSGESIGRCCSHTKWENKDFILEWKEDSSD